MFRSFITCLCLLGLTTGITTGQTLPPTPAQAAENAALLKGFIVTATLTKVNGTFASSSIPSVGNTFQIDLTNLPKEAIDFSGQAPDSLVPYKSFIPFKGALVIDRVRQGYPAPNGTTINLFATDDSQNFFVKVTAEKLEKGAKVYVTFLQAHRSGSSSDAAAEGVLK